MAGTYRMLWRPRLSEMRSSQGSPVGDETRVLLPVELSLEAVPALLLGVIVPRLI
jgi:hypothetical protein